MVCGSDDERWNYYFGKIKEVYSMVYVLSLQSPFEKDWEVIGIYSSEKNVEMAKRIYTYNCPVELEDWRFAVSSYDLDQMPHDREIEL